MAGSESVAQAGPKSLHFPPGDVDTGPVRGSHFEEQCDPRSPRTGGLHRFSSRYLSRLPATLWLNGAYIIISVLLMLRVGYVNGWRQIFWLFFCIPQAKDPGWPGRGD